LKEIVEDLEKQGLAEESEGATAVFLDGVSNFLFNFDVRFRVNV
jgi:arginyl-tRNA synthetase